MNGEFSDWGPVTSGIPQGSVLGPLLFVLYRNDLPDDLTSDIFLFADETKISNYTSDAKNAQVLQDDLDKLKEWSSIWLLCFHPANC